MTDKIYVDEIGVPIQLDAGEPITTSTARSVAVLKPDGTEATWSATVEELNLLQHITAAGDIDQGGTYRVQAMVTIGGFERNGLTAKFYVYPKYG